MLSQPAFPSTIIGKGKTAIIAKLHHHLDHVPIGQQSKELAGKVLMPYGVICCCGADKLSIGFLFIFKAILNILARVSDMF